MVMKALLGERSIVKINCAGVNAVSVHKTIQTRYSKHV
jgi:hypothetical protein